MPTKTKSPFAFSPRTFTYFDQAARHSTDRAWFDEHKSAYDDYVAVPFGYLLAELREALADKLPGLSFSERKLKKPLLRPTAAGQPAIRTTATAFLQETATSMFESNPGIYLSFGAGADDNLCGVGLYEPSGRQMKRLRAGATDGFEALDKCLRTPQLKKRWGPLSGNRYTRFPKGYDETDRAGKYLWQKQWFLSKHFTREQVAKPDFIPALVADLAVAVPFLQWTRSVVGVYQRPAPDASGDMDRLR